MGNLLGTLGQEESNDRGAGQQGQGRTPPPPADAEMQQIERLEKQANPLPLSPARRYTHSDRHVPAEHRPRFDELVALGRTRPLDLYDAARRAIKEPQKQVWENILRRMDDDDFYASRSGTPGPRPRQ